MAAAVVNIARYMRSSTVRLVLEWSCWTYAMVLTKAGCSPSCGRHISQEKNLSERQSPLSYEILDCMLECHKDYAV